MTPCPCGDPHPHTIATRRTYDNVRVDLDSDGGLWVGHQRTSTSGAAPVRTDASLARALAYLDSCRAINVKESACNRTSPTP